MSKGGNVMQSVLFVMHGAFRGVAFCDGKVVLARERNDVFCEERAWKLFFLLLRIVGLSVPVGQRQVGSQHLGLQA